MEILFISCMTIWSVFQNTVTIIKGKCYVSGRCPYVVNVNIGPVGGAGFCHSELPTCQLYFISLTIHSETIAQY